MMAKQSKYTTITLSIRLYRDEHAAVLRAAERLGWSPTSLVRRAVKLTAERINAAHDRDLAEVMTPLVTTEVYTYDEK